MDERMVFTTEDQTQEASVKIQDRVNPRTYLNPQDIRSHRSLDDAKQT